MKSIKRIRALWLLITDPQRFERVNYDSTAYQTAKAIILRPPL